MSRVSPDRIGELAREFLRLGATAFGGPPAHLARMRERFVGELAWLAEEEFFDMIAAANLIPGPSSTEVALHIGFRRAGGLGLLVAGMAFILPSALCVLALAGIYQSIGVGPALAGALYATKPVVVAIVLQSVARLLPPMLRSAPQMLTAIAATAGVLLGLHPLGITLAAGIVRTNWTGPQVRLTSLRPFLSLAALTTVIAGVPYALMRALLFTQKPGGWAIFAYFTKLGATLFGGGYVLVTYLDADLVKGMHWLTTTELFDAVAIGQFTPGPVFTTATFLGFRLGGLPGALAATVGIFLPGFLLVAATAPHIRTLRTSARARQFLDGAGAASVGLLVAVLIPLATAAFVDVVSVGIGIAAAFLLIQRRMSPAVLILVAALVGGFLLRPLR